MISTRFLLITFLIYITISILLFKYDPTGNFKLGNATAVVTMMMGLGIIFMFLLMSYKSDMLFKYLGLTSRNMWSIFKISAAVLSVLIGLIMLIFFVFSFVKNPPHSRAFFTVMNVLIFSTTILLGLYLVKDYQFTNPYLSLIQNAILYIPCLVYDLIDWAKYQYSITTPTAYIILGIDIALIAVNYMWSKLKAYYHHATAPDGLLLDGPVYLNERRVLGTFEDLKATRGNKNYSYRYGISFWIYINPQPPNTSAAYTEYSKLFDYGEKPVLLYKADENKLKIQVKINEKETKNIYLGKDMKLQKWNKFLINYDGGTLDIFLNDKLISSSSSIAPYMTLDAVTAGQNNGINGGIRDVVYFRDPVV